MFKELRFPATKSDHILATVNLPLKIISKVLTELCVVTSQQRAT